MTFSEICINYFLTFLIIFKIKGWRSVFYCVENLEYIAMLVCQCMSEALIILILLKY